MGLLVYIYNSAVTLPDTDKSSFQISAVPTFRLNGVKLRRLIYEDSFGERLESVCRALSLIWKLLQFVS